MNRELLLKRLSETAITKFTRTLEPDNKLPFLVIPPQFGRSDNSPVSTIWQEADEFSGLYEVGPAVSGLTIAASAHTKDSTPASVLFAAMRQPFQGKNLKTDLKLREPLRDVLEHLEAWIWGRNGTRMDLPQMAHLSKRERMPYIEALSYQIARGVSVLRHINDLERSEADREIEIYFVWGHATREERKFSGNSRGGQSNPDGHVKVLHLDYKGYKSDPERVSLLPATNEEIVKQIGPWDSLIFEMFETPIRRKLEDVLRHALPAVGFDSTATQNHGGRSDRRKVPFFEGYQFDFDEPVPIQDVFQATLDVIQVFSDHYDIMRDGYNAFHKTQDVQDKERIRFFLTQETQSRLDFWFDEATNLVDLALSIPPTRGQIERYIREITRTDLGDSEKVHHYLRNELRVPLSQNQSFEDVNYLSVMKYYKLEAEEAKQLRHLEQMLTEYEDHYDLFTNPKRAGALARYKRVFGRYHGLSAIDVDLFFTMIADRLKPISQTDSIEFTLPLFFSGSGFFEKYTIDGNGDIWVNVCTFASRLGTNKGVLEDIGWPVRREQGNAPVR